jgi:hypothetical protein
MPDIDPEEALALSQRVASDLSTAGMPIPPNMAEFGAAMMLIYADAMNSDCQCQTCVDVRNTLKAFTEQ